MNGDTPLTDMTIRDLDQRLTVMRDELRLELRGYVDKQFVTRADFETRMTRLSLEVVTKVSQTMQAMVADAMHEVASETVTAFTQSTEFTQAIHRALDARRAQDRKERIEDVRSAIGSLGRVVAFVNPILSLVLALVAVWAVFIR